MVHILLKPGLENFPQFVVIHTVKGFSVVNEAKVDVFLELSCFFYDPNLPVSVQESLVEVWGGGGLLQDWGH